MAASKNHVSLIGRLGADVEVRDTNSGNKVANISLATNEYTGKGEERQERTEWHRVVLFGKTAEIAGAYTGKGSLVGIEGRLQTRKWEKDGVERFSTEIVAYDLHLLGGKGEGGGSGSAVAAGVEHDDGIPF